MITIEQLKGYIGYGLWIQTPKNGIQILSGIKDNSTVILSNNLELDISEIKPVCYRLSDIHTLNIGNDMGLNDKWLEYNIRGISSLNFRYHYYERLWKEHFWVYEDAYFDMGLVIDKNKL
jgi:hypothetical protein